MLIEESCSGHFYLRLHQNSSPEDEGLSINMFSEIEQWTVFTIPIKVLWLVLEVSTRKV